MTPIIHLCSGGLDSTVLLYDLRRNLSPIHCVMVDYGQRHLVELTYAKRHCMRLGVLWTMVDLHKQKNIFAKSALTDGQGGNIVPNRNAVFLSIAAAVAMSAEARIVTFAANKDDAADFPDCRPGFISKFNEMLKEAEVPVEVCTPYIFMTKTEIVKLAKEHGFPYEDTHSCYEENDCGKCDACVKRARAIKAEG